MTIEQKNKIYSFLDFGDRLSHQITIYQNGDRPYIDMLLADVEEKKEELRLFLAQNQGLELSIITELRSLQISWGLLKNHAALFREFYIAPVR